MVKATVSPYDHSYMFKRISLSFLLLPFIYQPIFAAEQIEFPEEELATESVLPVFAKQVVVRERKINMAKRFEIGGGAGLNLVEPLYNQITYNIFGSYHFDEIHGVNISGYILSTDLSSAGSDLRAGKGLVGTNNFDASKAPTVESMFFANYQFTAYYGKISVTKQSIMNLSLYGLLGVGMVNWSDASTIGLDVGIGQKLYFTPNLALRFDLMLSLYQGPDPTAPKTVGKKLERDDAPLGSDQFDSTFYVRPFLTGGLIYIF
ncbi:MAG: outer membrane beta-barrel domain-containing protein [Bdellovibrionales bacterium]|nr:outer membrane beta-barrel domain-containing protein [Bdellovibrionales bacterium]